MCFNNIFKKIFSYKESKLNDKDLIEYWLNDPSTNLLGKTHHENSILPLSLSGYKGGGYTIESNEGRISNCYAIINNCLNGIKIHCPKTWINNGELNVYPMAGTDLNAYYDRKSIKYFYYFDSKIKKNVYLCESADVVTHELGHAILDSLRPDFWNVQSYEIWALHESFGDLIALISILDNEEILKLAIKETNGDLFKSNTISKLAEHFAKSLYNVTKGKAGYSPYSLRDAVNSFAYIDPKTLPEEASYENLSKECHSYSRILTGSFYEILIEIYNLEIQNNNFLEAMKLARNTITNYLFESITNVACTNKIFNALSQELIKADKLNNSKYSNILKKVLNKRNLIKESLNIQNFKISDSKTQTIKLETNLFKNLSVEIPTETKLEYDQDGSLSVLVDYYNLDEAIMDAKLCLESLYKNKLLGKLFEIKKNNLIREKFIN